MNDLEEIKKALEEVGPLKVEFTPDCDDFNSIIAPINAGYDGTYFTLIGAGDKQDDLGNLFTLAVNSMPELLSTIESLQRENEELRERQLAWRSMDSAPRDGKHCILSIPTGSGFIYSVQGAFLNGKWLNALDIDVEPLAWMPNVLLPDELCPWLESELQALASTGGEHHAQ